MCERFRNKKVEWKKSKIVHVCVCEREREKERESKDCAGVCPEAKS